MNRRVLIAMSGGVDSGVAAALMKDQGCDCIGAYMILLPDGAADDRIHENMKDAASICDSLDIPFYTFDYSEDFSDTVVEEFVCSYLSGRTPNPCITCNRSMKFGRLLDRAKELGCDHVATGHYARVCFDEKNHRYLLKKAVDLNKDQSYVLSSLTQMQLSHVLFPLGEMTKDRTRRLAEEMDLCNAKKRESQDICFIRSGSYADYIESVTGKVCPEGDFIDKSGNVLGRHKGIPYYTVGQRKGLGLAFGEPMYVIRIDPHENTVILGKNEDLFSDTLIADHLNLISNEMIGSDIRLKAKVRYRHPEQWADVTQLDQDTIKVVFDEPQRAITPGQSVVLYDGDVVVGGATIIR